MLCIKCKKEIDDDSIYCKYCGRKQGKQERKRLKNPNGYGSVIKLSGRRKKPYAVRVTDGIVDGKQIYRYVSYHTTKTEAEKALAKEQIAPSSPKSNMTLSEIYEEWITTPAFTQLSKQTQDNYRAAYAHLKPLHAKKFTDIRVGHMQVIIDALDRSKSTKQKIKLLLGLLYKYAMQNDICNKNYAEFIRLEREEKKEKEVFTAEEIEVLKENKNVPYVNVILILIYTGMRISELLTLKKDAVDFENNIITGGLKTDAGKDRTVPIHPYIIDYLKKWYAQPSEYLISRDDGKQITPNYFRTYIYYPLLEQLKIKKRKPHTTRHTCATLLAQAGADTNAIKQILGHTEYAFTADTYTHTDYKFLQSQINKI